MAGIRKPILASPGLPIKYGPEAASQTFKAGSPLIRSSGKIAVASGTTVVTAGQDIIGIACANASGTTDNPVPYVPCLPGQEFEFSFDKASDLGALTLAVTHLGVEYGLSFDATTGICYLDVDRVTTNACVKLLDAECPLGTISNSTVHGGIRVRGVFTLDQTTYEAS